jgi:hypothetical protein
MAYSLKKGGELEKTWLTNSKDQYLFSKIDDFYCKLSSIAV